MYTKQMANDNAVMRQRARMLLQATDNFGASPNAFDVPFNIDIVIEQLQLEFSHVPLHRIKRRVNDARFTKTE